MPQPTTQHGGMHDGAKEDPWLVIYWAYDNAGNKQSIAFLVFFKLMQKM
jgi:hypothetical protein